MDAAQCLHPTDQTLSSFALGKLDDRSAGAVNEHLMECSDCRKRVAEMSADSFLQKVRDAQKPSSKSASGVPQSVKMANTLTSSSGDSIPPELATHPDYDIKKELGRGGMGVVYLAHKRMMGRDVALKVMGQHLVEHSGVLERFLREIRSVAKLRHPNIVTAYHATRLGQSVLFEMEYVEGLDLSKLVKAKGPMPVAHASFFIYQAALGLQHAHEEGLVHRDIKPHNLMLSRNGDKATVKILDFGLAKAAREEKVTASLTSPGQALGTPDYIAPEQIMDAPTADIRADIYSLGGTLYFLLTGHPPFQEKSLYDLYQAHISRNAEPVNQVRPDVPAELAAVVAKMLAKDPAERFQTPGDVAKALKPFCTRANAALKIPKANAPQTAPAKAVPARAGAASAAPHPEADADRRTEPPKESAESESRWESMIDFGQAERELAGASGVAPRRWLPWMFSSLAVGVLVFGFLAAWMLKVPTPDSMLVLEHVPKDAEILVDGSKLTFTWPGGGKPVEIRALPGQHRVEVKKEGFSTFGQDVTISSGGSAEITVRLQPVAVNRPEPKESASPTPNESKAPEPKLEIAVSPHPNNDVEESGFVQIFNGKDLTLPFRGTNRQ
jgi:serine/threonine protein kinase